MADEPFTQKREALFEHLEKLTKHKKSPPKKGNWLGRFSLWGGGVLLLIGLFVGALSLGTVDQRQTGLFNTVINGQSHQVQIHHHNK